MQICMSADLGKPEASVPILTSPSSAEPWYSRGFRLNTSCAERVFARSELESTAVNFNASTSTGRLKALLDIMHGRVSAMLSGSLLSQSDFGVGTLQTKRILCRWCWVSSGGCQSEAGAF